MPNLEEQYEFFASSNWPKEEDETEKTKEKKADKPDLDAIKSEEPKPEETEESKATGYLNQLLILCLIK